MRGFFAFLQHGRKKWPKSESIIELTTFQTREGKKVLREVRFCLNVQDSSTSISQSLILTHTHSLSLSRSLCLALSLSLSFLRSLTHSLAPKSCSFSSISALLKKNSLRVLKNFLKFCTLAAFAFEAVSSAEAVMRVIESSLYRAFCCAALVQLSLQTLCPLTTCMRLNQLQMAPLMLVAFCLFYFSKNC